MERHLQTTSREYCEPHAGRYPSSEAWKAVAAVFMRTAQRIGTTSLLMDLALGRVEDCPFDEREMRNVKEEVIQAAATSGHVLKHRQDDRTDVPIDYRCLQLLLDVAQDPEVSIGSFAGGVRVGLGVRMPWLPALYRPKRKRKLPAQSDPLDCLEEAIEGDQVWRRNHSTAAEHSQTAVLEDQAERGQVLRLSEEEARKKYPHLVIASLGVNRKDKPNGVVSARVLFDGSIGVPVNRRTRIRDQERAPIAAHLKWAMREKAKTGQKTFALTADVSEAHRQVPIAESDWYLLGCQVQPSSIVYVNKVGTFGVASASYYCSRVASAVGRLAQYLVGHTSHTWAHAGSGRLSVRG